MTDTDNKKFNYICPSCKAKYELEMTDEEYNRFLDLYFDPGIEVGYKEMEEDDILYGKYKNRVCDECGVEYDVYPHIVINGVYTI